jgi:hypothetical protein
MAREVDRNSPGEAKELPRGAAEDSLATSLGKNQQQPKAVDVLRFQKAMHRHLGRPEIRSGGGKVPAAGGHSPKMPFSERCAAPDRRENLPEQRVDGGQSRPDPTGGERVDAPPPTADRPTGEFSPQIIAPANEFNPKIPPPVNTKDDYTRPASNRDRDGWDARPAWIEEDRRPPDGAMPVGIGNPMPVPMVMSTAPAQEVVTPRQAAAALVELAQAIVQEMRITDAALGGRTEVQLSLSGSALEGAQVKIAREGGALSVEFAVPDARMADLVTQNQETLREALLQERFQLNDVDIYVQEGEGDGGTGTDHGHGRSRGQRDAREENQEKDDAEA